MIPGLGITLVGALALAAWTRWLGGLYGVPRVVRHLAWVVIGVWTAGAAGSLLGMRRAFHDVSEVESSQKASMLAEGIAEALNAFALSSGALFLFALLALGLTWKYKWSARAPEVPRNPPYR